MKKVLFLANENPFPPIGCEKHREANLIRLLSEHLAVEVLCFPPEKALAEKEIPSKNLKITQIEREGSLLGKVVSPFRPYGVADFSSKMAAAIRERSDPRTALWISGLTMASYIPLARKLGFKTILDEHGFESSRPLDTPLDFLRSAQKLLISAQKNYYKTRFGTLPDILVAQSAIDSSRLMKLGAKSPVHVIPNAVEFDEFCGIQSSVGRNLFFSGNLDRVPNIEGMLWFTSEIMPRLRAALGTQLPPVLIATSTPVSEIPRELKKRLDSNGIEIHPSGPSLAPFLAKSAVVFVPIRTGSGTPLKILEAMAAGRAVVSTGKGAENLVLSPSYDIWIADQADGFTSAILRLLENPELRFKVGKRAATTVKTRYGTENVRPVIENLLSSLQSGLSPGKKR